MACTMSHCLCVVGNDVAVATTSVQDCPQHGEGGYHPDAVMWDCHEPEFPGYAYPVPRPGSVVSTPRNACPEDIRLSPRCDLAALRQQVQQARDDYYEQACDHGDMTGHGAQEERAWGAVQALDEVLGMLAEGERQEQLAADLGTHADLADPVHGSGAEAVFSRIDANWETEAGSL